MWKCGYGHKFCNYHIQNRINAGCKKIGGVAVIIYDKNLPDNILIGKQRGGSDKNQYSVVQGKIDPEDNCCYKKAALRELHEEFKIHIPDSIFADYFTKNGLLNYMSTNGTIVFIAEIDSSCINIPQINNIIEKCILDDSEETWPLREVEDVKWASMQSNENLSKFAKILIKKYKQWIKLSNGISGIKFTENTPIKLNYTI